MSDKQDEVNHVADLWLTANGDLIDAVKLLRDARDIVKSYCEDMLEAGCNLTDVMCHQGKTLIDIDEFLEKHKDLK